MAGWEVPSFTPLQDSGGSGGANRNSPRGGLAKGIPKKVWIDPTSLVSLNSFSALALHLGQQNPRQPGPSLELRGVFSLPHSSATVAVTNSYWFSFLFLTSVVPLLPVVQSMTLSHLQKWWPSDWSVFLTSQSSAKLPPSSAKTTFQDCKTHHVTLSPNSLVFPP